LGSAFSYSCASGVISRPAALSLPQAVELTFAPKSGAKLKTSTTVFIG
jgi:hypothetical protein